MKLAQLLLKRSITPIRYNICRNLLKSNANFLSQFQNNSLHTHNKMVAQFATVNTFDMMWQQASNKIKDVDSNEIFEQFKEEVKNLNGHQMALNYCLFILDVMKQRMEVDKALEVCNTAIDICENKTKNTEEPLLVMFKGQKALFYFKQGKKQEATDAALQQEQQFDIVKSKLNSEDSIGAVKLLQEVFQTTEDYVRSEKYSHLYAELISKDQQKAGDPFFIFQVQSSLFDCTYGLGKIKEALDHGLLASQQIEHIPEKNMVMHYLLLGVSFSYAQLNQMNESEEYLDKALNLIKLLPNAKKFGDLKEKKKEYQSIRSKIILMDSQKNQPSSNQAQSKEATTKTEEIWDEENDHGLDLKGMKDYKEALEFYQGVLAKLDSKKDSGKRVTLQDRMALVYYEMQDFKNAIETSKKAHQELLKLGNNTIPANKLAFQNLANLKVFYYQLRDWEKAVEWGKKWHKVCEQVGAFNEFNSVIEEYMIQHVLALKELKQVPQSLEYCKLLENYVFKFYKNDPAYVFSVRKLQYELNYYNGDMTASLASAVDALKYLSQLLEKEAKVKNQNKEDEKQQLKMKQEEYMLLKNVIALSLQTKDEKKIIQFGIEFLEKQQEIEGKDSFTRERQLIEMNIGRISSMNNDFKNAEKYLKMAVITAEKLKTSNLELGSLISLASILVRQDRLGEALEFSTRANLINQSANIKSSEVSLSIARIFSYIYQKQQDYLQCLEWVDKSFSVLQSDANIPPQQLQQTTALLKHLKGEVSEELQGKINEIAKKYNIKDIQ